ncbi:hypothetical protein VMUT_1111 [Vulcanisaeta moutnovskia 768-28]|uniref:Uncharacterized protein n=1 Tax=Vulcanisaeta moutnovskia (strain 768-28) TaxID=985053 RepID=F0QY79_VULM7|nr:DUF58 domain-containing protein [Vulcanisaeta moutnovskia]ADY01316.1 hypothetical protein VMUT_1111 [Vulcanisaeta moutnovskia 768-28]
MNKRVITDWVRIFVTTIPVVSAIASIGNIPLFSLFVVMTIITWLYWDRYPIPISLALIALNSIVTTPINIALTSISTLALDKALRTGNDKPWWLYASSLTASISIALLLLKIYVAVSLAVPTLYLLIKSLLSFIRFHTVNIELRPGKELRTNAGTELAYPLTIVTRPRLRATVRIKAPRNLTISPSELRIDGEGTVNIIARYRLGGVKRPRLMLTLIDEAGIIRVARVIRHPRITVIPRARAAVEAVRGFLAQSMSSLGMENVQEVREYIPGDPIRRIHWKKSAKLNRLTIKLMQSQGLMGPIVLLSYASNSTFADKIGEVFVYLTAELLTRIPRVEVISMSRDGEVTNYLLDKDNYFNMIDEILGRIENLGIRLIGGGDYADILSIIKYLIPLRIKDIDKEETIVIGQALFMEPMCKALGERAICISV